MPRRARSGTAPHPAARLDDAPAQQLGLFDESFSPAAAQVGSVKSRSVMLGGSVLGYSLKRGKRRTIGFTIDDSGLTVAAPRWVTLGQIDDAIREKSRWILTKLAEWREQRARAPTLQWHEGAYLPLFGVPTLLRLDGTARAALFDNHVLTLPLPPDATAARIRDSAYGWMQDRARALFAERLAVICAQLSMPVGRWALSSARTRWGSCTSDGTIRLNWRLLHFSPSVIDYVVAHEVAHRKELNHGPRFWSTVESIFPEYRDAEATLKFHAPGMLERGR